MTIKQLIPKMLLVAGLALTILVSGPSRVLSTDPVKSKEQQQTHTETVTENGKVVGTKTITERGGVPTKWTTIYTAGERAGTTVTETGTRDGMLSSISEKHPDGSSLNSVFDAKGGTIVTTTHPDGTVKTETYVKGGGGGDVLTSASIQTARSNGTVATQTLDPTTGKPTGLTLKDKNGNVTTTLPDGKGGFTSSAKGPDGKVETITYDPSGKLTGLTLKDKNGNVTAALPDGKGGFTSSATGEHGKVATSSYDADGKLTGETLKDKKGKVLSTTTVTPDGKGGTTSVTTDKHGKVISTKVYDSSGNVVSQTGKKQKFSLGASGQPIGGTQTTQGSGKHKDKHKLQAQFFQQNKDKSNVQDSGSSGASSGSGQAKASQEALMGISLWKN